MKQIEPKQIRIIKIAQKQLGIDDDLYREMLKNHFRVKSCTRLSYGQANKLIDLLKQKGFRIRRKRGGPPRHSIPRKKRGRVVRLVTQDETRKIHALAALVDWRLEDGLERWMLKWFGIRKVKTDFEAYQVIEGLKKLFENRMKRQFGSNWRELDFSDEPGIRRYIEEHYPAQCGA